MVVQTVHHQELKTPNLRVQLQFIQIYASLNRTQGSPVSQFNKQKKATKVQKMPANSENRFKKKEERI
jgi:hypothetical protein